MDRPLRILNVTTVFRAAGIESFIMNMYRNIDRTKVQFDFMVMRNEKEFYDDEISSLGGKKYTIEVSGRNTLVRILKESVQLYKFLKKTNYQVVHIHYTTPLRAFYLLAAKKAGVAVRIYHSHSAEVSGKSGAKLAVYNFCRNKIAKWATHFFACSQAAAKWMFNKDSVQKSKVIYNGIDIDKFRFNHDVRDEVRKELNLENNYVIAHTGRFLDQKNHQFIIKVFKEVKKRCPEAKLLLLGDGELKENIKLLVKEYDLSKDVLFLGIRSDVNRILNGADCYFMPSLYEGLPVAAVEAECSGLPCVMSTNITDEVKLTKNVVFLSLDDSLDKWRDQLIAMKNLKRQDESLKVAENGYSIIDGARNLQNFYLNSIQ